jgi:hypothetical protein
MSVVKRLTPGYHIGYSTGRAGTEQFIQSDLTRKAISLTIIIGRCSCMDYLTMWPAGKWKSVVHVPVMNRCFYL